jgi:hypothetical protein
MYNTTYWAPAATDGTCDLRSRRTGLLVHAPAAIRDGDTIELLGFHGRPLQ